LKQLTKQWQATSCTPLKIIIIIDFTSQKKTKIIHTNLYLEEWARFIRKAELYRFIENTLKIDNNGRNFNVVEKKNEFCNK
jgi:hypothetical protein